MSAAYPYPADSYLLIGTIARAHGLNGEVKINCFSGRPDDFKQYGRLALVAEDGRMTAVLPLTRVRVQGRQVIAKLETIDTRTEADLTIGMGVLLPRQDLPADADDEIPLHRLLGRDVVTGDPARVIGTVEDFFDNGAQDIMVVRNGSEEYLIPFVDQIIVSRDDKRIVIDPPPGLLEINVEGTR